MLLDGIKVPSKFLSLPTSQSSEWMNRFSKKTHVRITSLSKVEVSPQWWSNWTLARRHPVASMPYPLIELAYYLKLTWIWQGMDELTKQQASTHVLSLLPLIWQIPTHTYALFQVPADRCQSLLPEEDLFLLMDGVDVCWSRRGEAVP